MTSGGIAIDAAQRRPTTDEGRLAAAIAASHLGGLAPDVLARNA